jgi:hypothetical protein
MAYYHDFHIAEEVPVAEAEEQEEFYLEFGDAEDDLRTFPQEVLEGETE